MKFYDRENEASNFLRILELSKEYAQMTLVVGRRRIGKTTLLKNVFQDKPCVYFFVTRKSESLLCKEFSEQIESTLNQKIYGEINNFKDLFAFLMNLSKSTNFTLIIDEFQEFNYINSAIYGEIQNIWDTQKDNSKINLILCGSIYSLMKNIFENKKEPLFARHTQKIVLKEFSIQTIKTILKNNYSEYTPEDLLAFYLFTGGVPKYIELLIQNKAFTKDKIIDFIFSPGNFFLEEGKNVLIDEFGKDYGIYFSILSLIANSKTSRPEIEGTLGFSVGGHLDRLENDFSIIKKIRSIYDSPNSRKVKYKIIDNFLNFWFRFIFKYSSAIEIENFDYVKEIVSRDYSAFSGRVLEKYFTQKLIESKNFNLIGNYWENNNQNEIDIVAVNELKKECVIAEVKRKKDKILISKLQEKAQKLQSKLSDFKIEYKALSLEDM